MVLLTFANESNFLMQCLVCNQDVLLLFPTFQISEPQAAAARECHGARQAAAGFTR